MSSAPRWTFRGGLVGGDAMGDRNEHAKVELRRFMARRLIQELRYAEGMETYRYGSNGEHLTDYQFVPEQIQFIADVLERALNGDPDPMRLRTRGRKPEFRLRRLEAAAAMCALLHREGHTLEEARAVAAEAFDMSAETVRDAMRDSLIGARARFTVEAALFWANGDLKKAVEVIRKHAADSNSS